MSLESQTNSKDFNIFAGIDEMLRGETSSGPSLDHKLSSALDGKIQLERAPNPIVFIESERFLDGPKLFPVQYEIVRDFFELLCPHCNDIERIQTVKDVPREDQILFEYNVCPKCGLRKEDIADQLYNYNELIGVMGMRSGKGVLVGCICSAVIHELLCIENLQEKLGLVKNQIIDGAFVAASGEQASETVYGHFRGFYDNSPWFQNMKKMLMDLELSHEDGLRRGDLYREADKYINFRFKRIIIKALHSNSGSLAGRTRIFAVIDELSRFDAGDAKQGATEVYRVLKRSLLTIKAAVSKLRKKGKYTFPDARMFVISSPIFAEDKTMQLWKQSKNQEKMFSFRRATWEANPEIEKDDLADEFMTDPLGAERDYGANPPGAENPFVDDPKLIEANIDRDRPNMFTFREKTFDRIIEGITFNYITLEILNVNYSNLVDYVISCDPGRSKDCFALSIGHIDNDIVIIDGILEVRPIPKGNRGGLTPRQVHFPSMADIILDLNKSLSIKAVSYDRWQSVSDIDRLRDAKILAVSENLDRDDHVKFLESMRRMKVKFPKRESEDLDPRLTRNMPCAKALLELSMLNDDGRKVDHPANGTNDVIQTVVQIHRLLKTPGKVINFAKFKKEAQEKYLGKRFNRAPGRVVHLNKFR